MSRVVRGRYGLGPLKMHSQEVRTKLRMANLSNGRINLIKAERRRFKYRICWDTTDRDARISIVLRVIRDVLNAHTPGWRWTSREEEMSITKNVWKRATLWKWRHCMSVVISR